MSKVRCERFTLDTGDMVVYFPDPMSADDAADAAVHLEYLLKRIQRRVRKEAVSVQCPEITVRNRTEDEQTDA